MKTKNLHSGNWKRNFYVNVKTIFGLHLPFAIKFMFELKMSFKTIFYMTPGLIKLSYYISTSL